LGVGSSAWFGVQGDNRVQRAALLPSGCFSLYVSYFPSSETPVVVRGLQRAQGQRRAAALRKLVSTPPAAATDTVIISHRPNILDAFGKDFFDVGEGEALIFEPTPGTLAYRLVARVAKPETWTQWAQALAR
jgi:hypothetical protein